MCDLNKIGALIAAASAAVLVSVVICATAAIAAGTFWGAFGNSVAMAIAAASIAVALVSINLAIQSIGPCTSSTCKGLGDTVRSGLIALGVALTVLLAAMILGIVGTSIPWAGTAVAIGLGVGAVAVGVSLVVVGNNLKPLETCLLMPPSLGVGIATPLAIIAVIALAVVTGFVVFAG